MEALGRHLLLELYECDPAVLNDLKAVEEIMKKAAGEAEASILSVSFHQFNPHGVTGIIAIAESHFSVHTWPEYRYAAVDVFTCGQRVNPDKSCAYIAKGFKSQKKAVFEMRRGIVDSISF